MSDSVFHRSFRCSSRCWLPSQANWSTLEQPEIHLHPRAQVAMASLMVDAANGGVRLIVETHSALILLAIQALVAEGRLQSDRSRLHWFTRNGTGATQVASGSLEEAGAFGDWPEDFGDVEIDLQHRYLSAAESVRFAHANGR